MYIGLHVKYLLVQFLIKFEFSRQIFEKKNTQKSDFMKIRPVGAELFHADRWTDGWTDGQIDMTKLIVAFRNFVNAPTNVTAKN